MKFSFLKILNNWKNRICDIFRKGIVQVCDSFFSIRYLCLSITQNDLNDEFSKDQTYRPFL